MIKYISNGFLGALAAALLLAVASGWSGCQTKSSGGGSSAPPVVIVPPPPPSLGDWTVLTPSSDTRTVYVSTSDGNDANNGLSSAAPKATLSAGKALMRSGMPDWLVLKAGDTWTNQSFGTWTASGRSASEPMVITSYGTGARPLIQTGTSNGIEGGSTAVTHLAVVGLHFFPQGFTGSEDSVGVRWLASSDDVLFEDCCIEGFSLNFLIQTYFGSPPSIQNFKIHRCVVADSWSTSGHSTGLYAEDVTGLLVEECVFDHNGWKEGAGGAPATMFNHNTYISGSSSVALRGNLFLRASSMGNKFRSDATGGFNGLTVENNFYIEGEIGISIGGNSADPLRFADVTVRNNVMMHIGRSNPTSRDFAWYIEAADWDGGVIEDNLFLHEPLFSNSVGLVFYGQSERNTLVRTNVFYGIKESGLEINVDGSESGISVTDNEFQDPTEGSALIRHTGSFSAVSYQGNKYFSNAMASAWFGVNGSDRSYAQWLTASGETGSSNTAISYLDPGRDETTYQASLGGTATFAAFIAEARQQSKAYWRPAYTAAGINDYVRAGFGR